MPAQWLVDSEAALAVALGRHLSSSETSIFRVIGDEACRGHVMATLGALREDLGTGKSVALRVAIRALLEDLIPLGLSFSDLRFYVVSLRSVVLDEVASADVREVLDAWFFEFVMVCAMQFVVYREEAIEQRAAQREVQHLESQLHELKIALAEKGELIEQIRQASTPVVPVVKGILVAPLVGLFDTSRAELLTEKLLHEVARTSARSVILDISGVPVFDTRSAQLILRLARAVRLLGTELILVGVGPATARAIVELGVEFGVEFGVELTGLRVSRTLQDGLALALRSRRLKITPL
jgi:anti-anti-sigma factor